MATKLANQILDLLDRAICGESGKADQDQAEKAVRDLEHGCRMLAAKLPAGVTVARPARRKDDVLAYWFDLTQYQKALLAALSNPGPLPSAKGQTLTTRVLAAKALATTAAAPAPEAKPTKQTLTQRVLAARAALGVVLLAFLVVLPANAQPAGRQLFGISGDVTSVVAAGTTNTCPSSASPITWSVHCEEFDYVGLTTTFAPSSATSGNITLRFSLSMDNGEHFCRCSRGHPPTSGRSRKSFQFRRYKPIPDRVSQKPEVRREGCHRMTGSKDNIFS